MKSSKGHVELVRGGRKASATLEAYESNLTFKIVEGEINSPGLELWVDVFLFFKGTRITCRSRVISDTGPLLVLSSPIHLYRDLTRNYERIRPEEEIGVSILLDGTTLKLDFPQHMGAAEAEPPEVNVKFDASRIADLLKGFREKAKAFANEHKIVMFRERVPQLVVEHLVTWSGKILMLPVSDSISPFKKGDMP